VPKVDDLPFPPAQSHPHVKVCGLTRADDAALAVELGAAFIGLIFARESPRHVDEGRAAALLDELRAAGHSPRAIGVFVNEPLAEMAALADKLGLAAVQVHRALPLEASDEVPVPLLRAIRVRGAQDDGAIREAIASGYALLDTFVEGTHGGTGKVFDHSLALPHLASGRVFIAGGLNPGNIAAIAGRFREAGAGVPYAFDVSSGLEASPGVKDHAKMRAFFAALSAPRDG